MRNNFLYNQAYNPVQLARDGDWEKLVLSINQDYMDAYDLEDDRKEEDNYEELDNED